MSGFGILKVEWEDDKKKASEKRINHTISPLSLVYDTKLCHDNAPLVTRRKCSSTTEYLLSWEWCKGRLVFPTNVHASRWVMDEITH